MSWVKLDDQLHAHPKVARAWQSCPAALGLHLMAMSHSGCYGTNGQVDAAFVTGKIPGAALRKKAVAALVDSGLWDVTRDGWKIHDWEIYNGDAESREAARKAKVEAGKKGAAARWGNSTNHGTRHADAITPGDAPLIAPNPNPVPYPTAFLASGLTADAVGDWDATGDPGPEPPSNVVDFRDGKTVNDRGVA
jgi:hypothetical protein